MNRLEKLLSRIAGILDREGIPYMIIGGQAVLIHGEPRFTRDIDITLGVSAENAAHFEKALAKNDFKPACENPASFARETNVFPVMDKHSKVRVDFLFSDLPYERAAIARAESVLVAGTAVRFIRADDLLIYKLIAGRPRDIEDASGIWARKKKDIDLVYIQEWLSRFSALDELKDILERWNSVKRSC